MSVTLERITRNVCNILINRPTKRNAINLELSKQLQNAIHKFEQHNEYSVAILSGVGGNFCSGYDVNEMIDHESGMPQIQMIEQMLWPLGANLSDKKIVIASIEGHAAGFGYELALKCDFRVAERDSRMGFLNRRFGIPIMNGGTVILPELIGRSRAIDIIATGKAQLAPQALEYGLLSFVSDVGCSMGQALNLSRMLAKFRQDSLLHDLKHIRIDRDQNIISHLKKERNDSIEYLKQCGPLDIALKFLQGKLGRHGNTDLGNALDVMPVVTL